MQTGVKPSILIVEDDRGIREVMADVLSVLGTVVQVDDGDAALDAIAAHKPDCICIDLALPQVSGFSLCAAIRANPTTRDIPVLVVSGRTSVADRTHARESGATEFLSKPFKNRDLLLRVTQLLGQEAAKEVTRG